MIEYLTSNYPLTFILILPESYKNSREVSLLKDTITWLKGSVGREMYINENDIEESTISISSFISMIKLLFPYGTVILNYLENSELFNVVYKSLFVLLSPIYNDCETSYAYSKDYLIISQDIILFNLIEDKYKEGHLCRISGYSDAIEDSTLHNIGHSIYGDSYLSEKESISLISFELITQSATLQDNKLLIDRLNNNEFSTSFGIVKVNSENYAEIPAYILIYEKSELKIKTKLYQSYPSNSYKNTTNSYDIYNTCNSGNISDIIPTPLLLLLPLEGEHKNEGYDFMLSYLVTIDYLNSLEENNRIYSPLICNYGDDINVVKNKIKEMVENYHTRTAFGIYRYLFI